jgi:hypothetical protein
MREINTVVSPKINLSRSPPQRAIKKILSDLPIEYFINIKPMAKFIAEIKKPAIIDLKRIAERTEIINKTTSAIRTINDEM